MFVALIAVALAFVLVLAPARVLGAQRAVVLHFLSRYGLSVSLGVTALVFAMRGSEWFSLLAIGGALLAWPWPRRRAQSAPAIDPEDQKAHAILGVSAQASASEIRAAFRKKIAEAHPDRGGSQEQAARLVSARDRLLRRR
ncbi:MAG: J domain-containing protein [Pseudomonadota bacterium]